MNVLTVERLKFIEGDERRRRIMIERMSNYSPEFGGEIGDEAKREVGVKETNDTKDTCQ